MAAPPPAPTPPPSTDYAAKIEDLEIIATGDLDKINERIKQLKDQRGNLSQDSPEYKSLDSRIKILEAAATAAKKAKETENTAKKAEKDANKKDKGSSKSDDDLAYWSGRVANASTNAFSASVNGVSVGVTGISASATALSLWLTGGSYGAGIDTKSGWVTADEVAALKKTLAAAATSASAAFNEMDASGTEAYAAWLGSATLNNLVAGMNLVA